MARIGYIKVMSNKIVNDLDIFKKKFTLDEIFVDKLTESTTDRPKLRELLKNISEGDTIIVQSIFSFAHNSKDFINLLTRIQKKNVGFISIFEDIDTTSDFGKHFIKIVGAMKELEDYDHIYKQRKGIKKAQSLGKYKGRKKITRKNFKKVYKQYESKQISLNTALQLLDMKKNTFYRRVAEYKKENEIN